MIITVLLTTALTVAAWIIYALADNWRDGNALIAAQHRRIELLEQFIDSQRDRIDGLVEANGDLEDRNACLERVQRRNLHNAVVSMPVMDGPRVLGRAHQITLN